MSSAFERDEVAVPGWMWDELLPRKRKGIVGTWWSAGLRAAGGTGGIGGEGGIRTHGSV